MKILTIRSRLGIAAMAALLCAAWPWLGQEARAEDAKTWRVPVVMEKSTVRGKVVILESRNKDRRTIEDIPVEVWTQQDNKPKDLVHRTRTDGGGLFDLPTLEVGEYILTVAKVNLELIVLPVAAERQNAEEPKILLILLPKDVV